GAAEAGRAVGRVAAVPLQPGARGGGQEPADARLEGAQHPARAVPLQRDPLPHAAAERRGARRGAARAGAPRRRAPLAALPADGGAARAHELSGAARVWREGCGRRSQPFGHTAHRSDPSKELPMVDLTTFYLGLRLRNPLVASASPLSKKLDRIKRLEAA